MPGDRIPHLTLAYSGDGHRTSEHTMGIRKNLAKQLTNAAKALESDKSKENISKTIFAARVGIANAIMPKIPPIKR